MKKQLLSTAAILAALVLSTAFFSCKTSSLSSEKAITSYSLNNVTGTVDESAHTISAEFPCGTEVTALVATFTASEGSTVAVGGTAQVSGETANDFTNSVTYTVTAEDGSTQNYTVNVTIPVEVSGLTATSGDTKVTLNWTNPSDVDFDHVEISWTTTADPSTNIGSGKTTSATDATYTATGLTNGTSYTFTVKTVDAAENISGRTSIWQYAMFGLTESVVQLASGTDGSVGTTGTYVQFGDWPQTIKADSVKVSTETATVNGRTYYYGNDGFYYEKFSANPYDPSYTFTDGDNVLIGKKYYFKVEPIKWRVVTSSYTDADGNNKGNLLLAESVLLTSEYSTDTINRTENSNDYKYSIIRAYLNGLDGSSYMAGDFSSSGEGFLTGAFTSNAQGKISTTTVDNSLNQMSYDGTTNGTSSTYVCDNTQDKIFLLSAKEAFTSDCGFDSSSELRRKVSDYALAEGENMYTTEGEYQYCGWWWLRSPCYNAINCACYVGDYCLTDSFYHVFLDCGVVPALSISF